MQHVVHHVGVNMAVTTKVPTRSGSGVRVVLPVFAFQTE